MRHKQSSTLSNVTELGGNRAGTWIWLHTASSWICCSSIYPVMSMSDLLSLFESSVQFSSVAQSCPTLCDPMNHSTPGLPVHHQLLEFTQTHVHWVGDAIQPSHYLSSPSPPALSFSQNQDLFQWVSSSHKVAKVLEFQLQHQSFQWIFRTDFWKWSSTNNHWRCFVSS